MIAIIICSKQQDIEDSLKTNIKDTIGVPYELIVIDNSKNEYSIFEAYNEGVKRASCNFLCFMHEDICCHSQNWGKSVIDHLSNPEIGLIGLAGSYYLLPFPSPWFDAKPYVRNLIQYYPSISDKKLSYDHTMTEDKEVICVDGFWFCSRKDVFEKVSFDTESFHGFHFYDMDISMQIHEKGYLIYVISDIKIAHLSNGCQNSSWIDSSYIFYYKWEKKLPEASVNSNIPRIFLRDIKAFKDLLYIHKINNYPISKTLLKIGWKRLKLNVLISLIAHKIIDYKK
jgi:GT2 family glycosyltransferase